MIRIDSHFHPNFSFVLPRALNRRRAKRIWAEFKRRKLDAVFVSEHSFRKPAKSYKTLLEARPTDATTTLIPAVEALTKEGMDVIVFSKDTHVYKQADILMPHALTLDALIQRVRNDLQLHAILPHPYTLSDTAIMDHYDVQRAKSVIKNIHAVEKFNASLRPLQRLAQRLGLDRIMRKTAKRMEETADVPQQMIGQGVQVFGGSDAHHVDEIGTHLCIHTDRPESYDALFEAIVHDRHDRSIVWRPVRHPLVSIIRDGIGAFKEHLERKLHLYSLDTTFLAH